MDSKKIEIALCLSGGGYKAATYHLGMLSYLNQLPFGEGHLLDYANIISTISGGTITGLWYMMNLCKGIDTEESLRQLYHTLYNADIPKEITDHFIREKNLSYSLIKLMSEVYDEIFFHGERFSLLLDNVATNIHVHQFTANCTDFSNAMAFHFQASSLINSSRKNVGIIGNDEHRIPLEIASHIKLSDILASSSCFPGVFEPLVFPQDFSLPQDITEKLQGILPFGLMDGGIIDNQGIDPIPIADAQMTSGYAIKKNRWIDIIIVSDVASSEVKSPYRPSPIKPSKWWGRIKLSSSIWLAIVTSALALASCIFHFNTFLSGFFTTLSIVGILLILVVRKLKKLIPQRFSKIKELIYNISISEFWVMLKNRYNLLSPLSKSFMKQIRKKSYDEMFNSTKWTNRIFANNLYLSKKDGIASCKILKHDELKYLCLSEKMFNITEIVDNCDATLSFSDESKQRGIPQMLVVAGQYSICWNLLRFIYKLKNDPTQANMTSTHQLLIQCEPLLLADWNRFKEDPYWLFNTLHFSK